MINRKITIAAVYAGINLEYQDKICQGMADAAKLSKFNLAIFAPFSNTTEHSLHDIGEEKLYDLINFSLFDAMIIIPSTMTCQENTDKIIQRAHKAGVPVISIDRKIGGCHSIGINYGHGFDELMDHLIVKHKLTKINFVGAYEEEAENDTRLSSYKKALKKHHLSYDKNRVFFGEYNEYTAIMKLREYFASGKELPEAFVCANDSMAIGICDELVAMGHRVPEDVIVTGYDGMRYAMGHNPSITTVMMAYYKAGENAVNLVPEILDLESGQYLHAEVRNRLLIGESCGCVKKNIADDNLLTHSLNEKMDRFNMFSKRLVRMSEELTSVNSFDAALHKLRYYVEDIYVDRFYLCLNTNIETQPSMMQHSNNIEETSDMDYTPTMNCCIAREYKEYRSSFDFKTSDMLPALFKDGIFSNVFFFTPLHFQNRNFGYIALSVDGYSGSNTLFNTWRMNVSIALENVRVKNELTLYSSMLERLYIRDPLTNLYNRRGLYTKADELFKTARQRKKAVMVFAADLDCLKPINDKYGHHEGDNALILIANTLNRVSKHREICSRFGGDEFEVIGFNYSEEMAQKFSNDFQELLGVFNRTGGKEYDVCASFGYYVSVPDDDATLEEFIRLADEKLYECKRAKKEQYLSDTE